MNPFRLLSIVAATIALLGGAHRIFASSENAATPTTESVRPTWVYFGTSTGTPSSGIYVAAFDAANGRLGGAKRAAPASYPVFLAIDPTRPLLYSVEQVQAGGSPHGEVASYQIDPATALLTPINRQTTDGGPFCYIGLDRSAHFLGAARFGDGNAVILPVDGQGKVGPVCSTVQHHGSSAHKTRQEKAHAHSITFSPSNRFALVADLGIDEIRSYRFDAKTGGLTPNDPPSVHTPPGAGPRHLAFHPSGKFVYAVLEVSASVGAYAYDADRGSLQEIQIEPLLPPGDTSEPRAAEVVVHPSGKFLYVSNRGYDELVVFAVDPTTGKLTFVQREHDALSHPRNFALDPSAHWLLCANRDADNVIVYSVDQDTGKLTRTSSVARVPQPICVRFYQPAR